MESAYLNTTVQALFRQPLKTEAVEFLGVHAQIDRLTGISCATELEFWSEKRYRSH
jgi:hypothetical protein